MWKSGKCKKSSLEKGIKGLKLKEKLEAENF